MKNRFELLQEITDAVDSGNTGIAYNLLDLLKEHGIEKNMHVGKQKEIAGFFDDENHVAEWYLGSYFSIIEDQAFFAMNSLINQSYAYLKRIRNEKPQLFEVLN